MEINLKSAQLRIELRVDVSLELGRKLGLTGSLIEIIAPVLMIVTLVAFLFYLFTTAISSISSGQSQVTPTFPFAGLEIFFIVIGIAWFIGYVLFIIAMHQLSQHYNEPAIFKNTLYGFIVNIVTAIALVTIEIILIFTSITRVSTGNTIPVIATATPIPTIPPSVGSFLTEFIIGYLAVLAVAFILAIVSGIFYMRAFNKLAEKSGVDNFKTAGLLYLIGAVTAIVGIGALIQWIAWIFAAMGYRSLKLKEPLMSPSTYTFQQPTASSVMGKNANSIYCSTRHKQLK